MIGATIPYRGPFPAGPSPFAPGGRRRPLGLLLPPAAMPGRHGLRPLKAWRYLGVYGPELMICIAAVRIGPVRQAFWAVWDRRAHRLYERTAVGRGAVALAPGRALVRERSLQIDLRLEENGGIETVCPSGNSYGWTRKQGGIRAHGYVRIGGTDHRVAARAIIDDTAAYYERHTMWRWSAGVGTSSDGRELAWNLVSGVNDPPRHSERTIWIAGEPVEIGPNRFAPDLARIDFAEGGSLRFHTEAVRTRRENLLLIRSSYRQPFGTFGGELPGGIELAEGYGVVEEHDVRW